MVRVEIKLKSIAKIIMENVFYCYVYVKEGTRCSILFTEMRQMFLVEHKSVSQLVSILNILIPESEINLRESCILCLIRDEVIQKSKRSFSFMLNQKESFFQPKAG